MLCLRKRNTEKDNSQAMRHRLIIKWVIFFPVYTELICTPYNKIVVEWVLGFHSTKISWVPTYYKLSNVLSIFPTMSHSIFSFYRWKKWAEIMKRLAQVYTASKWKSWDLLCLPTPCPGMLCYSVYTIRAIPMSLHWLLLIFHSS